MTSGAFQTLPKEWSVLPFTEALVDKTSGNSKVKTGDYLPIGKLPVVDQGQSEVAGFVDDVDLACKEQLPCILFGDHTKVFKYVEHPFALGADGVKVLVPTDGFDKRYLYHYLSTVRLPDDVGYSRHFKYLKRASVPKPPIAEQKRIAAILDKADAIRRKRQQAIQLADEFLRSVFLEMFGDPVTNPKGWDRHKFSDLCRQITVGIVVKPASYYVDVGVPALRSLNVRANRIEQANFVYFSEEDNAGRLAKTRVFTGDIVLVRSGQPGTAAVVPESLDGVNAIDILIARPKHHLVDSVFLAHFFNSPGGRALVLKEERGQIQKHLNVGSLSEALIPLPPFQEQERFRKIVERVSLLKKKYEQSDYEDLFSSLSQRAFQGAL